VTLARAQVFEWLQNISRDDSLVPVIVPDPADNSTLLKARPSEAFLNPSIQRLTS
jgi:hypothetical protein